MVLPELKEYAMDVEEGDDFNIEKDIAHREEEVKEAGDKEKRRRKETKSSKNKDKRKGKKSA